MRTWQAETVSILLQTPLASNRHYLTYCRQWRSKSDCTDGGNGLNMNESGLNVMNFRKVSTRVSLRSPRRLTWTETFRFL